MIVREKCIEYLTARGLWPQEAEGVIEAIEADDRAKSLAEILDKNAAGYPEVLWVAVSLHLDAAATKWIDANKPQHFARPMFAAQRDRNEQ